VATPGGEVKLRCANGRRIGCVPGRLRGRFTRLGAVIRSTDLVRKSVANQKLQGVLRRIVGGVDFSLPCRNGLGVLQILRIPQSASQQEAGIAGGAAALTRDGGHVGRGLRLAISNRDWPALTYLRGRAVVSSRRDSVRLLPGRERALRIVPWRESSDQSDPGTSWPRRAPGPRAGLWARHRCPADAAA